MTAIYKVSDEAKSNFFLVPNLIDNLGLSVYAFRLYCRMKRVAGEDGKCWQSTKTLADACKMSPGSVVNARRELMRNMLIRAERVDNPHGGRDYYNIKIIDIWARNAASSPHELASSLYEVASSPGELKNTPLINTSDDEEENSRQIDSNFARAIKVYELNIGPITQAVSEDIKAYIDDTPFEWFEEAAKEAATNNKRSWGYMRKIIQRWKVDGFKSDSRPKQQYRTSTRNNGGGKSLARQFLDMIDPEEPEEEVISGD